jgi:hypothetical protein
MRGRITESGDVSVLNSVRLHIQQNGEIFCGSPIAPATITCVLTGEFAVNLVAARGYPSFAMSLIY